MSEDDGVYPEAEAAGGARGCLREPRLASIFQLCRRSAGQPRPAEPAQTPAARAQGRVRPTPANRQPAPVFRAAAAAAAGDGSGKVAAIFARDGRAAADVAAVKWPGKRGLVAAPKRTPGRAPLAKPGSARRPEREAAPNTVVLDRATGQAFFVHEDGRRSPRQL